MSYSMVLFLNLFFYFIHKLFTQFNNFSNCKILIFQLLKLTIFKFAKL